MANIAIIYEQQDTRLAQKIRNLLIEYNHSVFSLFDLESDKFGGEEFIEIFLKKADGLIIIDNNIANKSLFFKNQIALACGYLRSVKGKFILPVITDDCEVPEILNNFIFLRTTGLSLELTANKIIDSVLNIIGRNKAENEKKKEEIKRINENSEKYIEETLKILKDNEYKNRRIANFCYIVGYITLVIGIIFGIINFEKAGISFEIQWYQCVYLSARALIVLLFLGACTKYTFSLGKAYMNESLKNADRRHAISFGKFYLQAYGDIATWNELKEVFQYWNLDKNSYFTSLNSSEFDPKIVECIEKIASCISKQNK